jgi:hypothetical protein
MAIAGLAGLMAAVSPALAQSAADQPSPLPSRVLPIYKEGPVIAPATSESDAAHRAAELQRWMDGFTAWKQWWAAYVNRREPGVFGGQRERREKPAPPDWLPAACETAVDDAGLLASACALLAEWRENPSTAQQRQARAAAVAKKEDTSKTIWWEHLHADLLWPAMQWQTSVYGVVGMHTSVTVSGRLQIFTAPGITLLNLPARYGGRTWKLAANYGIGYRLSDFTLPGGRPAVLHVNLARAWIVSEGGDVATGRRMDFAGFSLTFKKGR